MSAVQKTETMSYPEAVGTLAEWHGQDQDPVVEVYSFDDPEEEEVRLLEVSEAFFTSGEVLPLSFRATEELPYVSTVILLSPEEYGRLRNGELGLPEGWGESTEGRKVWPN